MMVSFVGLVIYLRFGSFMEFGYGSYEGLAVHTGWESLVGLLVSPGAGILIPIAQNYMYRENRGIFYLSIYIILLCGFYFHRTGSANPLLGWGQGWGPRYLMTLVPFIAVVLRSVIIKF